MQSSPTPRETSPQSYSPMVVINDNKKCSQKNVNGDQVKVEDDKENIHRNNGFGEKRNNIEKVLLLHGFQTYFIFGTLDY